MDWLKLFALLVAVASVEITAEGPKKKIRIHLPQKVKHIHHHKKIYITNHPAPSQYAPAYLPGVKGALALPSNAARPAVASIVPLNSVEVYDEARSRLPGVSQAASKLLPLYRARGHYGPQPAEWDEHDFEMASSPEQNDIYSAGYTVPAPIPPPIQVTPSKKYKIVKINETPRKKVLRKIKPKRVIIRPKQPQVQPQAQAEEEHPVSTFHEQFYSDLEEGGTIRKIKKPPRIEKIIDGDTEHIHTYSEEHIHKVVFDDDSKVTGVVGVDPIGSMTNLNAAHPLVPLKNAQSLVAYPSNSFPDLSVMGSMGTPSHLEYAAYNPRDVTHDHIFHDHGELPHGLDITKEGLRLPPKISYNHNGLRVSSSSPLKRYYGKRYSKPTKPPHDFTYYEGFYGPNQRPKKLPKPTTPTSHYEVSAESHINDFRPVPALRYKDKRKQRHHNYAYNKPIPNFNSQQASVPAPFSVSSTVVHDYDPKGYAATGPSPSGFSKYLKEPLADFRDSYHSDADYDAFASSSNIHTSDDQTELSPQGKTGKKSISTQNISFGGPDHQNYEDHFTASASDNSEVISPTAMEEVRNFHQAEAATPTPYTIKETSPAHPYYTAMALKALQGELSGTEHDNEEYGEQKSSQTPATESTEVSAETPTTSQTFHVYKIQSTDAIPEPDFLSEISETRPTRKRKERNRNDNKQRYNAVFKDLVTGYKEDDQDKHGTRQHDHMKYFRSSDYSSARGNPQYGDKI